jgi:hypothetical protein
VEASLVHQLVADGGQVAYLALQILQACGGGAAQQEGGQRQRGGRQPAAERAGRSSGLVTEKARKANRLHGPATQRGREP